MKTRRMSRSALDTLKESAEQLSDQELASLSQHLAEAQHKRYQEAARDRSKEWLSRMRQTNGWTNHVLFIDKICDLDVFRTPYSDDTYRLVKVAGTLPHDIEWTIYLDEEHMDVTLGYIEMRYVRKKSSTRSVTITATVLKGANPLDKNAIKLYANLYNFGTWLWRYFY